MSKLAIVFLLNWQWTEMIFYESDQRDLFEVQYLMKGERLEVGRQRRFQIVVGLLIFYIYIWRWMESLSLIGWHLNGHSN